MTEKTNPDPDIAASPTEEEYDSVSDLEDTFNAFSTDIIESVMKNRDAPLEDAEWLAENVDKVGFIAKESRHILDMKHTFESVLVGLLNTDASEPEKTVFPGKKLFDCEARVLPRHAYDQEALEQLASIMPCEKFDKAFRMEFRPLYTVKRMDLLFDTVLSDWKEDYKNAKREIGKRAVFKYKAKRKGQDGA